jgi:predicted NBD/HSP70 family sugar kinase
VFEATAAILETFEKRPAGGRVLGVGLAMPGPFDVESMSFVGPTTLEGWRTVPIRERVETITGLPAFIEVDHRAAAQGEFLYGAGRGFRHVYYLHFGVGLGGCMILDGQPMRGTFGNAGEIGHMPLVPDGEACSCGNRGCLERYVSLEAFRRRRDAIGVEGWIEEAAPVLRAAIAIIENVFDPETIVIGGVDDELPLADLLARAEPLANSIGARADRTAPRILRSNTGKDAALRGAAASAVAGLLSPRLGSGVAAPMLDPDPMFARGRAA